MYRVIGLARNAEHRVAGAKQAEEGDAERVSAAGEAVADYGVLRTERLGIDAVELFPTPVAVAVAGRAGEIRLGHSIVYKGGKHLLLIVFRDFIYLGEFERRFFHRCVGGAQNFIAEFKKVLFHFFTACKYY